MMNPTCSLYKELNMENKRPIRELISLLEQELIRMGYKEATLSYYRDNWRRIIAHFDACGESYFSEAVAMQYVDEKCGYFAKERAGQLTQSNVYLFRVVRMIGDFQQHGTVLRRYQRSLSRVNEPGHLALLHQFTGYCQDCDYAVSTQKSYARTAENFLCYVEARGLALEALTAADLTAYVKTLMGYSYKMVEFVLCGTRSFLRFLHDEKVLASDLSGTMPSMQVRTQANTAVVVMAVRSLTTLPAVVPPKGNQRLPS
jgi:hypothetical protein